MRLLEELFTFAFASLFFCLGPGIAFAAWESIKEKYADDYDKRKRREGLLIYGCGAALYLFYSALSK